jgi:ABC-type lipoprotein export system ATPase subunit
MTPRVQATAVEKHWTDTSGLRPTTFSAEAGELVVVQGRSGSGKSTLLAIIAGLCPAGSGEVVVDGSPIAAVSRTWERVTFVPQTLALADELTLRENIADAARSATAQDVQALLVALDLVDLADRPPSAVSMGQQQRAAVARALVSSPLVLLADEPTSHQDASHSVAVVDALRAAAARGTTVIVATHEHVFEAAATQVLALE